MKIHSIVVLCLVFSVIANENVDDGDLGPKKWQRDFKIRSISMVGQKSIAKVEVLGKRLGN
jgi:hypothetical protein